VPITPHLFEAYVKCQTKCFLRSLGERATGDGYSDWVRAKQATYRSEEIKRLTQGAAQNECVTRPIEREDAQSAKWRFAVETTARAQNLESTIHAVERMASEGRAQLQSLIPVRFIFTNKLQKDDTLLLAFDSFVLSEMLGCEVGLGKIIHGDNRDLKKANLFHAILSGADLSAANLNGANFYRVDLRRANLRGAYLSRGHPYFTGLKEIWAKQQFARDRRSILSQARDCLSRWWPCNSFRSRRSVIDASGGRAGLPGDCFLCWW
jgi:hypothetical protein